MSTTTDAAERRDALAGRVGAALLGALDLQAIYLGRPPRAVPRPRRWRAGDGARTGRAQPGSTRATPASGSSSRPSARSSTSTTWTRPPTTGGTRCRPATTRSSLDAESLAYLAPLARFVGRLGPAHARPPCRVPDRRRRRLGRLRTRRRRGPGGASTGRSSRISSATGSTPCRTSPRACATATGGSRTSPAAPAGRRSRSPAHFPGIAVDGIDIDAGSIERAKAHAAAEGLTDRVSFLFADAADSRGRRPLRPRDDLRGRPRHGPPGRGARGRPATARAGRSRAHRRRARRRTVHRAGRRGRAAVLRLQRRRLPGQRPRRPALGRDRARSCGPRRSRRSPARRASRGSRSSRPSTSRSASTASTRSAGSNRAPKRAVPTTKLVVDALRRGAILAPQIATRPGGSPSAVRAPGVPRV